MGPISSHSQILKAGLQEHEAMLSSFASRVAVGGDLEQIDDALVQAKTEVETNGGADGVVIVNQKKRNRNKSNHHQRDDTIISPLQKEAGTHRTVLMELAGELDHYRKCMEVLEALDGKDATQVEAFIQRLQEGPNVYGGRDKGPGFQIQMAESLGITLDRHLSQDGGDDDDEEEMAIIVGGGAGSSTSTSKLRCPITTKLMEDPVRNSLCGHTYSKEAILQHLRVSRRKECPVAGCSAVNISPRHLTEDIGLTQLVRRRRRREDAVKERRQLSPTIADKDGNDEDGNDDGETVN